MYSRSVWLILINLLIVLFPSRTAYQSRYSRYGVPSEVRSRRGYSKGKVSKILLRKSSTKISWHMPELPTADIPWKFLLTHPFFERGSSPCLPLPDDQSIKKGRYRYRPSGVDSVLTGLFESAFQHLHWCLDVKITSHHAQWIALRSWIAMVRQFLHISRVRHHFVNHRIGLYQSLTILVLQASFRLFDYALQFRLQRLGLCGSGKTYNDCNHYH